MGGIGWQFIMGGIFGGWYRVVFWVVKGGDELKQTEPVRMGGV